MTEEKRVLFLRGPRGVVLRPPNKKTDLAQCVRAMNDPDVTQYLRRYLPMGEAEEEKWFDGLAERRNDIVLAIETPEGRFIGTTSLFGIDWKNRLATFGVVIFEQEFRERGFGADATMALFDYGFNRLNLHKVCSSVFAFNERSRRLHAALGMTQEGVRRKENFFNGEYHDELIFGVFREEWEPAWRRYRERVAAEKK
jgi:RimJ/RimL family protein N-acetyltransferase